MSDKFSVKSRLTDYEVRFVDGFSVEIRRQNKKESIFLIDRKVFDLYKEKIGAALNVERIILVEGVESNKSLDYCQQLIEILLRKNIRKNYTLIAIGGGIIQDIAAFTASILFRGINWSFFPTTLLAQADSCIGSKTSINQGKYKNMLGGFYPPVNIFIDLNFLDTLPDSEIKSGIGEILHFYFIDGSRLLQSLAQNYNKLLMSRGQLKKYISESLRIKKKTIQIDEFDKNERNLFNYGHTFGHAIETITGYGIGHGQAVTMGMDIANHISLKLGLMSEEEFGSMHEILALNLPSFQLQDNMIGDYLIALSKDKKNIGENLVCILSSGRGAMKKVQIPIDAKLKEMIRSYYRSDSISGDRK